MFGCIYREGNGRCRPLTLFKHLAYAAKLNRIILPLRKSNVKMKAHVFQRYYENFRLFLIRCHLFRSKTDISIHMSEAASRCG